MVDLASLQAAISENAAVNIHENSGQIAIGNYVVQIGSVHGGVVNITMPEQQPRIRPRPAPVLLRPRRFPDLLDRKDEFSLTISALQAAQPVEFYGQAGWGKTSLLRHLAYDLPFTPFPDGVIYLPARQQPLADLLQSLYEAFYESDLPCQATQAQLSHGLQAKQALILLDDLNLNREETLTLLDVAPNCAFLLASPERHLWGEGRAITLPGLPSAEAVALLERELGRSLTTEEQPAAQDICAALEGQPLLIVQVAALVREKEPPLAQIVQHLQRAIPAEALSAQVLALLSPQERQVVGALAALGGAPLPIEHLAALTGLRNPAPVVEGLLQRGVLQAHSPRYSLTGNLGDFTGRMWNLSQWVERAFTYLPAWAERQQQHPERLLEEIEPLRQMVAQGVAAGRWAEVLRLARAVEGPAALDGRWGVWQGLLQAALQAGQMLEDRATEAWALHQLGTRWLALGEAVPARTALIRALRLRTALGDSAGAAVTRHNLNLLLGPPPGPQRPPETPAPAGPTSSIVPALLAAGAVLLAVPLLLWLLWSWLAPTPMPQANLPQLRLEPGSLTFTAQPVGVSSPAQSVTFGNIWITPLAVKGITLTGAHPADFRIVTTDCLNVSLKPGGQCTISVSFTPTAAASRSAELLIIPGDSAEPRRVSLTGMGVSPPLTLTATPTPSLEPPTETAATTALPTPTAIVTATATATPTPTTTSTQTPTATPTATRTATPTLIPTPTPTPTRIPLGQLNPQALDFGRYQLGQVSQAQTVRLTNVGGAVLTISNINLSGANPGDFSFDPANCPSSLSVGFGACTLVVRFRPGAAGIRSAILMSASNTPDSPHVVPLSGSGVGLPQVRLDPSQVDFGEQEVKTPSDIRLINVVNVGSADLLIDALTLSGSASSDFSMTDTCRGATLPLNGNCTVSVRFAPTTTGPRSADLIITANAPNSPQQLSLTGLGVVYQSDLVTQLEAEDAPVILPRQGIAWPIRVTVQNQGRAEAPIFKVAVEYTGGIISPGSSFVVPFTADSTDNVDPGNGYYPFTRRL
ncbi:MAG: choice-of-anchor D domain-containing protein [Anaerolineae bacterium]